MRDRLNVFEVKCMRSMSGVSHLDILNNEVVRMRICSMRELVLRLEKVLRLSRLEDG